MNSIILALRFTLIILFLSYPLFSQITLNLSTGQDATVRITNTTDSSFARSSDPSSPSLLMHSWTNSSDNFNMVPILSRSLINFEGLSSIPAGSVIKSATIHLKCSINDTYFPSHNFSESGDNSIIINRIPTPWMPNTVTWINQPRSLSGTTQDSITRTIQGSKQNFDINITNLVQSMINQNQPYGFTLALKDESFYDKLDVRRNMSFGSFDNASATLRPTLDITYCPPTTSLIASLISPQVASTADVLPSYVDTRTSFKFRFNNRSNVAIAGFSIMPSTLPNGFSQISTSVNGIETPGTFTIGAMSTVDVTISGVYTAATMNNPVPKDFFTQGFTYSSTSCNNFSGNFSTLVKTYKNVFIPDAEFKRILVENTLINTNGDTEIQFSEAEAYTETISLIRTMVVDLTGIEAFKNITKLQGGSNIFTKIDLSGNILLKDINLYRCNVEILDLSKNLELINLSVSDNRITTLNISKCNKLQTLDCSKNKLTKLDCSGNPLITSIHASDNLLTTIDVSKNLQLTSLSLTNNTLGNLDVSKNVKLNSLDCFRSGLSNLDVSANTSLTNLSCDYNNFTTLNVSKNILLNTFSCTNNPLLKKICVPDVTIAISKFQKDAEAVWTATCTDLYPDLTFGTTSLSTDGVVIGGSLTISSTIRNLNANAAPKSVLRYYLSTDQFYDISDTLLGLPITIPEFAGIGESALTSSIVNIPTNKTNGNYFILFFINRGSIFPESNSANNLGTLPVKIGNPDLNILPLNVTPLITTAGADINIGCTILNAGVSPSPSTTLQYELSKDSVISNDDVHLTPVQIPINPIQPNILFTQTATSFKIPATTASGNYILIIKSDASNLISESDEKNNYAYIPISLSAFPDLTLTNVLPAQAAVAPGATINIACTVNNTGGPSAASTLKYYISPDNKYDNTDIQLGNSISIDAFAGNGNFTVTPSPFVIPSTIGNGSYNILLFIDRDSLILESNNGNNIAIIPIQVGSSDLALQLTSATPNILKPGDAIDIACTVANVGASRSSATTLHYALSDDSIYVSTDIILGSLVVNPLNATITQNFASTPYAIPLSTLPGNYYIILITDPGNINKEINVGNNKKSYPITIGSSPDLTIKEPSINSNNIMPGSQISLTATVSNLTNSSADATSLSYYLSVDPIRSSDDILLVSAPVPLFTTSGDKIIGPINYTIPITTTEKKYYIIFEVDEPKKIFESNELNNYKYVEVTIGSPDIELSTPVVLQSTIIPGDPINISCLVSNVGFSKSTETDVQYFISNDLVIDGSDTILKPSNLLPILSVGQVYPINATNYTIPKGMAPGKYFLLAIADKSSKVFETNKNNNFKTWPITIGASPDLKVQGIAVLPNKIAPGETFSINSKVSNVGSTQSGNTSVLFYISKNTSYEKNADSLIGNPIAVKSLTGGEEFPVSLPLNTIPLAYTNGNYYILMIIDQSELINESDELNNIISTSIQIGNPDIKIASALVTPFNLLPLQSFKVSGKIVNSGISKANQNNVNYYLSTDTLHKIGDDDIELSLNNSIEILSSMDTLNLTEKTFVIPQNTLSGFYYLLLIADANNQINESNEINNTTYLPITIGSFPDLKITVPNSSVKAIAPGQKTSLSCTISNMVNTLSSSSTLSYYLSSDNIYKSAEDDILGSVDISQFEKVESREVSSNDITIPLITKSGNYYILFIADSKNQIGESDEINNVAYTPITIGKPDLSIFSATISLFSLNPEDTLLIRSTIKNNGIISSNPTTIQYFLSPDSIFDELNVTNIFEDNVRSLTPQGIVAIPQVKFKIPTKLSHGKYYIHIVVGTLKSDEDSDESNNVYTLPISVLPTADLAFIKFNVTPKTVILGEGIDISCSVINNGQTSTSPNSNLQYYFSTNDVFGPEDDAISPVIPIGLLGISKTKDIPLGNYKIPTNKPAGNYYILLKIDGSSVKESNTQNNVITYSFELAYSNLTIFDATVTPKTPTHGEKISIGFGLKNFISENAPVSYQYYLSKDLSLDTIDTELNSVTGIPATSSDGSVTIPASSFVLNNDLKPGVYYILILINRKDINNPLKFATNIFSTSINLLPFSDLQITNEKVLPNALSAGDSIQISATILNKGLGNISRPFNVNYYFSFDKIFDKDDDELITKTPIVIDSIGALSEIEVEKFKFRIRSSTHSGRFYIFLFVDQENKIPEFNDANNFIAIPFRVASPDLEVFSSSLKKINKFDFVVGDTLLNSYIVKNIGKLDASKPFTVTYYLSTDEEYDKFEDTPIGDTTIIKALEVDSLYKIDSKNLLLPYKTLPGKYFVLTYVNSNSQIKESNEQNNWTSKPVEVAKSPELLLQKPFAFPSKVLWGDSINISCNVKNLSGTSTNKKIIYVSFYISLDNKFDKTDTDISKGGEPIGTLIVGDSGLIKVRKYKIPDDIDPGAYNILFFADSKNNVIETNEMNNLATIPIIIKPRPSIRKETIPTSSLPSKPVDLSINVKSLFKLESVNVTFKQVSDSNKVYTTTSLTRNDLKYNGKTPDGINDKIGLEYIFYAIDTNGNKSFPYKGVVSVDHPDGLSIPYKSFGGSVSNYRIISIPLKLKNNNVKDIFEPTLGQYDRRKWRLFNYERGINVEYTNGLHTIEPGKGYWLAIKNPLDSAIKTGAGTTVKAMIETAFSIQLQPGWNQIGNPYLINLNLNDFKTYPLNDSSALVQFKKYEGTWINDITLKTFEGAFVLASKITTLYFPTQISKKVSQRLSKEKDKMDANNWQLNFTLSSETNEYKLAGLGMNENANLSKDNYDDFTPPKIGDWLEINFDHPEYFYPYFSKDIVPTADKFIWDFDVTSALPGMKKLQWDKSYFSNNYKRLFLYDEDEEKKIDMGKYDTYTFESNGPKKFKVFYGDPQFVESNLKPHSITLGNPIPNPFSSSTIIPVTIPSGEQSMAIDLSVYNLLGVKVATLANANFASGFYEFDWNVSKDEKNILSGIYLIKLKVKTLDSMYELNKKVILK